MIDELKRIFEDYPGESEVVLEIHTRTGPRRLRLGEGFKVAGRNAALKAELDRVLGAAVLPPAVATPAYGARRRAARREALPAQLDASAMSTASTSLPWPGPSNTHGRPSKRGSDRNAAQPSRADLAVAEVAVAVAVGAERRCGVVDVQRAEPVEADHAVELVEHGGERLGGADVVAGGEQVAGVQADAEPLVAAGGLDQPRELLERAPERAAGAGGVLEVQRAVVGLGERLGDHLRRALDRRPDRAP